MTDRLTPTARLRLVEEDLGRYIFGRKEEIRGALLGLVARNHIGVIAGASDPRPTGDIRQHDRVSSENRAMPAHIKTADLDGRVLEFGLAGDWIDRGIDGGVDGAGARDLRRPMHGRKRVARS